MARPVCLVAGVGAGTGLAVCRRFANEGHVVAMVARTAENLSAWAAEIPNTYAYPGDVSNAKDAARVVEHVERDLGTIDVLIHNARRGIFGNFLEIEAHDMEECFRINALSLLHLAKVVAPGMIERKRGAIVATGNTSALRGSENFAAFAPSKAAQRILAESMARHLGPKGVHVAYVLIDAVIDMPWARENFPDKPDDFFAKPDGIAQAIWNVVNQEPSTWSFNVELRPFGEKW